MAGRYIAYYAEQAGGGGVRHVYAGAPFQRGSGIGSFLGGIFRQILPYLGRAAKAVGKEAVHAGLNVFDDVVHDRSTLKDSFKARLKQSKKNLSQKAATKLVEMMKGGGKGGYKKGGARRKRQSVKRRSGSRKGSAVSKRGKKRAVGKKKRRRGVKKRTVADIFGSR